jgi:hypothetical protein
MTMGGERVAAASDFRVALANVGGVDAHTP